MKQGVLRFITAGSVDDGKSTLIGRLLYDTKAVLSDQLVALSKTKYARVTAHDASVDLALLTDGLEAEREQGITIDVAYRYFATAKRKFIVADAPGHEQYTRNLVTGASQADVAVILVDATRVDLSVNPPVLLDQTKRHSALVKLLGLKHIVFAINKMDLVEFDQKRFEEISSALKDMCKTLGIQEMHSIPMSALLGDNVVTTGDRMPWYNGKPLLEWLEDVDSFSSQKKSTQDSGIGLRFPVQFVARQDGNSDADYRGYLGKIESGEMYRGQKVKVLPGQSETTITAIHIANQHDILPSELGEEKAYAGQVVAISLEKDIDISRGDMIIAIADGDAPQVTKKIQADLCWLDQDELSLARKYILRHTTNQVFAKVKSLDQVLDVKTLSHGTQGQTLKMNDIGIVQMTLQKTIAADLFDQLPATGAFVLIDEISNHTVAAGMIRRAAE